jgi:hypothetical protein
MRTASRQNESNGDAASRTAAPTARQQAESDQLDCDTGRPITLSDRYGRPRTEREGTLGCLAVALFFGSGCTLASGARIHPDPVVREKFGGDTERAP